MSLTLSCLIFPGAALFSQTQHAKQKHEVDVVNKIASICDTTKKHVRTRLPKFNSISTTSFQNTSLYKADMHPELIIRTQRRERLVDSLAVVGSNNIKTTRYRRAILSSN